MKQKHAWICAAAIAACAGGLASRAHAHGFVGDRFFPATVTTDDPFAVDEFSLNVTNQKFRGDGEHDPVETDGGFEFVKEILPRFAVGVEDTYIYSKAHGEESVRGFDSVGLSLKYELWQNDTHEAIVSIGMDTDLGGTGSNDTSDSFTTFTPTIYFGKGFGDLPDSLNFAKPLAITGTLGQTFPTSAEEANALEWAFAIEYSLPYLQQRVKDVGFPEPLRSMIPLVEFSFETPENRGENITTGTINPGVLWETKYFQLGVEALIPVNRDSGDRVGMIANLQIYIDDLWPAVFGHPVWGER